MMLDTLLKIAVIVTLTMVVLFTILLCVSVIIVTVDEMHERRGNGKNVRSFKGDR